MFVDQREYKEEWYDGEFSFKDLNEELFKNIIAGYYSSSSGMGGPGIIRLLTKDNKEYEIGLDLLRADPFYTGRSEHESIQNNIPLFETTDEIIKEPHYRHKYKKEDEGFTYINSLFSNYLIKDEYLEYIKDIPNNIDGKFTTTFNKIRYYLTKQGYEKQDYIYEGTKKYRLYLMDEWNKYEKEQERIKIRDEDVKWKPIYHNNQKSSLDRDDLYDSVGEYLLLFREDKEIGVYGQKFSIIKEWKDRCISKDSNVITYNLFCKRYYEIEGKLGYDDPNIKKKDNDLLHPGSNTFRDSDINDYGEFIYAHLSMEDAKKEALKLANGNLAYGGFNKENLINDYPSKEIENQIIFNKYYPIVLYAERYKEILDIITKFRHKPNTGGRGFIVNELVDKLNISKTVAIKLLNITLDDLIEVNVEYAKQRVKETYENI